MLKRALAGLRDDATAEAHLMTCQAWQHNSEGRDSLALKAAPRAVEAARRSRDPITLADALALHATYQSSLGDQPSALINYAEAARLLQRAGVSPLPRELTIARVRAYCRVGDLRQARLHLQAYDHSLAGKADDRATVASLMERSSSNWKNSVRRRPRRMHNAHWTCCQPARDCGAAMPCWRLRGPMSRWA